MPPDQQLGSSTSMTAHAAVSTALVATRGGDEVSRVRNLRSHGALVLRPVGPHGPEPLIRRREDAARVSVASAAAGPLGGDDFALDVIVGRGSTLLLDEVSSTVLLPGARGGRSHMRISILVEDDATLVWLPEPLIAASGCLHVHQIDITLESRARLMMRDELVLGRYGEQPGRLSQHLRVRSAGRSIFQQQLDLGPGARGWTSPAVLGGHKCVGTVLAIDTRRADGFGVAQLIGPDAVLMPLHTSGAVVSALADDTVRLRRSLERGIDLLGGPWTHESSPAPDPGPSPEPELEPAETSLDPV